MILGVPIFKHFRVPKITSVIILNWKIFGFYNAVMCPNDVDEMADSVERDGSPLVWVCTVSSSYGCADSKF